MPQINGSWDISIFMTQWPWFDLSRSSKVKGHGTKWKPICGFLLGIYDNFMPQINGSWDISIFMTQWPWFDLSRSSKVKGHGTKWKAIYDFLLVFNSNYGSILHRKGDIGNTNFRDLDLTFQGRPRSNVKVSNESSYLIYYKTLIVTVGLSCTVKEILAIKISVTLIWPFKVIQGQMSRSQKKAYIWFTISL